MEIFRVRLNCVDHYQANPTSFDPPVPQRDESAGIKPTFKVPVIRVFGSTENGQKVCAHIHGAFPYLFVEYHESLAQAEVNGYIHRFQLSIDHALAVSYRKNPFDAGAAFVAHISMVKGIPFYGYHVGFRVFLKVYLLNPLHITRLADLLRQGAIMKRSIQPFESHMQYIPQWMCDNNLFGCGYLNCSKVMFRAPLPDYLTIANPGHHWHDRAVSSEFISRPEVLPRQSRCAVEVDVSVQDILNRSDVKERPIHHDFVEKLNPVSGIEKLVPSMAGLWRDETRRRRARLGLDENSSPFPPEVMISVSAELRNSQPGGWIHEQEYFEALHELAQHEKDNGDFHGASFHDFVRPRNLDQIQTAFASVEDLYDINLSKIHAARKATETGVQPRPQDTEIDEGQILAVGEGESVYGSEEEMAKTPGRSQNPQTSATEERGQDAGDLPIPGPLADGHISNDEPPSNATTEADTTSQGKLATSSAELKLHGIKDVKDSQHHENHEFAIPEDYASEITAAMGKYAHSRKHAPVEFPPRKRRRVFHDEGESLQISATEEFSRTNEGSIPDRVDGTSAEVAEYTVDTASRGPALEPGQEAFRQRDAHNGENVVAMPRDDPRPRRIPPRTTPAQSTENQSSKENPEASTKASILNADQVRAKSSGPSEEMERPLQSNVDQQPQRQPQTDLLSSRLHREFQISTQQKLYYLAKPPPTTAECARSGPLPPVIYQDAYYSNDADVPERPREYAGKEFRLESNSVPYLPDFDASGTSTTPRSKEITGTLDRAALAKVADHMARRCTLSTWEIAEAPPRRTDVEQWLDSKADSGRIQPPSELSKPSKQASQIEGPSPNSKHGFKSRQRQDPTGVQHETQYMSLMSLEVHINTRRTLMPNPEEDEIACVFWCLQSSDEELGAPPFGQRNRVGILILSDSVGRAAKIAQSSVHEVEVQDTELDLINRLVDIVRRYDPDILTGFEVHGGSWGYVIERARCQYEYNICDELSRMKSQSHGRFGKENDKWGFNQTSTIRITGRHMINIWRAMRGELNLLQYTMENVVFHVLHQRIPHFSFADLTSWFTGGKARDLAKVIDYFVTRVQLNLEVMEKNELIPRTSEQARLLGVDFFSVFSRGSQFKVESLMFRIAKPENLILISPGRKQVGEQNALECLPLVMEPQSAFYTSPVLVLDFQSLYPSVMIAYNYCYSTCLGRMVPWRGHNKLGFTDFKREPGLIGLLEEHITIAPNGIMYVRPEVRKSLLAKMLGEILETRVMVKSGMKADREDGSLQRLLNNRQLALKLIANVTYGYTSASFSGRMPCSEIADSIVQTARETLEKAIALIHSVEKWDAEVVYGDTDSLFVCLKGRSRDEAFAVGEEIAKAVTDMNPRPVKLKFEKVYHPCVLLAKKRYVGFKYESKTQVEPEFDAKGIETVRRDGTPAEQKIEEKALKVFFRTADLSQVKEYFQEQCSKIMRGRVSIQDFCFAKEVRLGTYSDKGPPPPGALISTKRMLEDPRAEPQYGQRVPYVVITGAPAARLIDRCVAPEELLENDQNELDAEYYITKNLIPPLERIFNLVGANVRQWYDEMPKFQRIRRVERAPLAEGHEMAFSRKTLESYMKSSACIVCGNKLDAEIPICVTCASTPERSILVLRSRMRELETKAITVDQVCRSCSGQPFGDEVRCDSKDCPVFYTRIRHKTGLINKRAVMEPMLQLMEDASQADLEW